MVRGAGEAQQGQWLKAWDWDSHPGPLVTRCLSLVMLLQPLKTSVSPISKVIRTKYPVALTGSDDSVY